MSFNWKNIGVVVLFALSLYPTSVLSKERVKKVPTYHVCFKTDHTREALACNIYKEGRGEGFMGMMAVGLVTINRQQHEDFPLTVKKVVYQKKQFSWANSNKNMKIRSKDSWEKSLAVADLLLFVQKNSTLYKLIDFTNGSLYYHTLSSRPVWRHKLEPTIILGNHTFYKKKDS